MVEPLIELKLLTSMAVPGFCERFVSGMWSDGHCVRHSQAVGRRLMTQQNMVQAVLKQYGWQFDIAPHIGMFLWISHPDMTNLDSYRQRLEQSDMVLLPGAAFSVTRNFQRHTRINIAHMSQSVVAHFDVRGGSRNDHLIMSTCHGSVRY